MGIFHSGMYEYDNTMAYVSIESAQKFFGMGDQVTGIEVKTGDIYKVTRDRERRSDASSAIPSGPKTGWR